MIDRQNIEITVKDSTGQSLSFSIHDDSTINEYVNVFKTILTFLTFTPQTIQEIFYDESQ